MRPLLRVIRTALTEWKRDRAPKMAAALAYYTAFAVAPLLLIAIAVAGLVFGPDAARGAVVSELAGLVGPESAEAIQEILRSAWKPKSGIVATVLGAAALLLAASGVFGELQDSLNVLWKVRKRPGRGILGTLKDRFLSFTMVVGIGFLLLVSLVVTAMLEALGGALSAWGGGGLVVRAVNLVISFGVITLLFAAMFEVLPDAETRWKDALVGGAVTALLFTVGKFLIGLYLGKSSVGSAYGAAGSFVIFLLWVNYSAQIVFLGAEFTRAYAGLRGAPPRPDEDAQAVECAPLSKRRGRRAGR
jgi:membrane protein